MNLVRIDGQPLNVSYATFSSSGVDLRSEIDCLLLPMERMAIPTGLRLQLDPHMSPLGGTPEIQIRPRSGLALKYGITVLNSPGTVDFDYEGEIKVILINLGEKIFNIKKGDKIAQAVLTQSYRFGNVETEQKLRGIGGFGSTDVK